MLKMGGRGDVNGKPVELMIIGLSHKNLDELKKGHPIKCRAADFGVTGDIEILIFSGQDRAGDGPRDGRNGWSGDRRKDRSEATRLNQNQRAAFILLGDRFSAGRRSSVPWRTAAPSTTC